MLCWRDTNDSPSSMGCLHRRLDFSWMVNKSDGMWVVRVVPDLTRCGYRYDHSL
jgi:hypothetical protein